MRKHQIEEFRSECDHRQCGHFYYTLIFFERQNSVQFLRDVFVAICINFHCRKYFLCYKSCRNSLFSVKLGDHSIFVISSTKRYKTRRSNRKELGYFNIPLDQFPLLLAQKIFIFKKTKKIFFGVFIHSNPDQRRPS